MRTRRSRFEVTRHPRVWKPRAHELIEPYVYSICMHDGPVCVGVCCVCVCVCVCVRLRDFAFSTLKRPRPATARACTCACRTGFMHMTHSVHAHTRRARGTHRASTLHVAHGHP